MKRTLLTLALLTLASCTADQRAAATHIAIGYGQRKGALTPEDVADARALVPLILPRANTGKAVTNVTP